MTDTAGHANAVLRRAFLTIDPEITLRAVDSLDLTARARVSAVVGVPLRQLRQRRDVAAFATTAPVVALRALLELIAHEPLDAIVGLLGDHADSPTYEQLVNALDELLATGLSVGEMVALMAYAVGESFPAAPHCRRLFDEREEFALVALPEVSAPAVLAPAKQVSPEIREQRRVRREEEKRRKRSNPPSRPPRSPKLKNSSPQRPPGRTVTPAPSPSSHSPRRSVLFTPLEFARFRSDHPLVGAVLVVEVTFDARDPLQPDAVSKERPVLVVAANDHELLVRAIYSNPATTRSIFQPWRRVGLDHVSYIDDARVVVANTPTIHRLGQLTTLEWNLLS